MSKKRFELTNEIRKGDAPTITIEPNGAYYLLTFKILIKGTDLPDPPPSPDPQRHSHRDIELNTDLFVSSHTVKLKSPRGQDNSKLELSASLDSKIPGTPSVRKKK